MGTQKKRDVVDLQCIQHTCVRAMLDILMYLHSANNFPQKNEYSSQGKI